MEFDKSKVYTALNAEDLPIGSKCIFADDLGNLKRLVNLEDTSQVLIAIKGEYYKCRFEMAEADCMGDTLFALAYLIEPPAESKYKPFESVEKAMEAILKHGGWIKSKDGNKSFFITGFNKKENVFCFVFECWHSLNFLFAKFVWADDGSPCGELVEE